MKYYICLDTNRLLVKWIFKSEESEDYLLNSVLQNTLYSVSDSWDSSSPLEGDLYDKGNNSSYNFSYNYTYEFPLAYNSEDNLVSEEEFRTAQVNNFYTNNIQLIE